MIKNLKLTNFRKHEDLDLSMSDGMIIFKARNEFGKSSIIEATMYALYGSRVLRDSLADTVSYGKKDNTLKVEALFEFNGDEFLFVRHKGGAEVYVNGANSPHVTGQTEVTTFATQLIGADAATANKLMVSSQGNLRGALEQGPKATAEMIEDLAEFELFDFLLGKMDQNLALGSSGYIDKMLETLQTNLDSELDKVGLDQEILVQEDTYKELGVNVEAQAKVQKAEEDKFASVMKEVDKAEAEQNEIIQLDLKIGQATKDAAQAHAQVQAAQVVLTKPDPTSEISRLTKEISDARQAVEVNQIYKQFKTLTLPDTVWAGTKESFEAEEVKATRGEIESKKKLDEAQSICDKLERQIITQTTCPTCDQEIKNAEEIKIRNAEIEKQLEQAKKDWHSAKVIDHERKTYADALFKLRISARPFEDFLLKYSTYVGEGKTLTYPPTLNWIAPRPKLGVDIAELERELKVASELKVEIDKARNQIDLLKSAAEVKAQTLNDLKTQRAVKSSVDKETILALYTDQKEKLEIEQGKFKALVSEHYQVGLRINTLKTQKQVGETVVAQAREQISKLTLQKDEIEFNNSLLKKVRQARPLVSDKLWNMVLAAVSTMFSQMRGEHSLVTKEKNGFRVNGEPVTGLSGSTLDILGAAIRVALIRTFIPNCPFIVYDEPFASMDADRTQAMIGFIQSCGFNQTIIVTHEDVSEQVADQLITLGE